MYEANLDVYSFSYAPLLICRGKRRIIGTNCLCELFVKLFNNLQLITKVAVAVFTCFVIIFVIQLIHHRHSILVSMHLFLLLNKAIMLYLIVIINFCQSLSFFAPAFDKICQLKWYGNNSSQGLRLRIVQSMISLTQHYCQYLVFTVI